MNLNISLEQPDKKLALFGSADKHLRMIRDAFGVQLVARDDELRLSGEREQVGKAALVLDQMQRDERGIPPFQKGVFIEGVWREGKTLRKAATKSSTQICSLTLKVAKAKCFKTKQTSKIRLLFKMQKKLHQTTFKKP